MTTEMLIVNGLTALVNLTIRLIESRQLAAEGMARSEESEEVALAELEKASDALCAAIERAKLL